MPNARSTFPRLPHVDIYQDDFIRSRVDGFEQDDLADARLTRMLKQVSGDDAKELARPIKLLGHFKPAATLARVKQLAEDANGKAALVVFDEKAQTAEFFWSRDADESVSKLTRLKISGAWLVGIIVISDDGWAGAYPELADCEEQKEFYCRYLNLLTSIWMQTPKFPAFAGDPDAATTTLNGWSEMAFNIHDEIILPVSASTENGLEPKYAR